MKEDGWSLYGFDSATERQVFQRLLGASGFGPKLALALLSALGPERTVRSILRARPRGAELGERHRPEEGRAAGAGAAGPVRATWSLEPAATRAAGSEEAVQALMGLGYGRGGGRRRGPRGAGRRALGRDAPSSSGGRSSSSPPHAEGRTHDDAWPPPTAEWNCTRCGATNRKLVPSPTSDPATGASPAMLGTSSSRTAGRCGGRPDCEAALMLQGRSRSRSVRTRHEDVDRGQRQRHLRCDCAVTSAFVSW